MTHAVLVLVLVQYYHLCFLKIQTTTYGSMSVKYQEPSSIWNKMIKKKVAINE